MQPPCNGCICSGCVWPCHGANENRKRQQHGDIHSVCQRVREAKNPILRSWHKPSFKSGKWKKKPQDSIWKTGEGFDNIFACRSRQKSKKPPVFKWWQRYATGIPHSIGSNPLHVKNTQPRMWLGVFWQRMRDSNPRKRSQSPVCYRYTNPLNATTLLYAKRTKSQGIFRHFEKFIPVTTETASLSGRFRADSGT